MLTDSAVNKNSEIETEKPRTLFPWKFYSNRKPVSFRDCKSVHNDNEMETLAGGGGSSSVESQDENGKFFFTDWRAWRAEIFEA